MATILLETADGVGTITLNRPEKLNAFAGTMREELLEALGTAEHDRAIRVVVITGAGRAFSSGGDVEAMAAMQRDRDTDRFAQLLGAGRDIVTAIRRMKKIAIASINGVAAGAGCNLALACDYRIASRTAKLGETFVRIGLHPDWGGTWFLPRLVGPSRAMELLTTGRMIDAEEALRIGMVDQVEDPDELPAATRKLAQSVADGPPHAIEMIKSAVYRSEENHLRAQLDLESGNQLDAFTSSDAAEGIAAFLEKRAARFGR